MDAVTAILLAAVALAALGLAYWRWGYRGLVGAALALAAALGALMGARGRPPGPPPPPPGDGDKRARKTAGDIMHRVAETERAKVVDAASDPDKLADVLRDQR